MCVSTNKCAIYIKVTLYPHCFSLLSCEMSTSFGQPRKVDQCYELFGGIALKNHAFFYSHIPELTPILIVFLAYPINALLYIIVVLAVYSISIVIMMVKYLRRENKEAYLRQCFDEYVARDVCRYGSRSNLGYSKRLLDRQFQLQLTKNVLYARGIGYSKHNCKSKQRKNSSFFQHYFHKILNVLRRPQVQALNTKHKIKKKHNVLLEI